VNAERDPLSLFWYAGQVTRRAVSQRRIALLYWAGDDIKPCLKSLRLVLGSLSSRVAHRQRGLWRSLMARARRTGLYRRRITAFLTALITSSAAGALEQDGRRMESRPFTDRVPAAEDGAVKREAGR
jgi:hypothetical protein